MTQIITTLLLIDFDNVKILHPTLGIWDVMEVLPKDLPRIDGVISLKSFYNKIVSIDLDRNFLIVETQSSYHKKIRKMSIISSRFANGPDGNELVVFLGAVHDAHTYWFLLDSGNISQFILSHSTTYDWKIRKDTATMIDNLNEVEFLFGKEKRQINVVPMEIIYEVTLNYDFISRNIYTLNFKTKEVWIN